MIPITNVISISAIAPAAGLAPYSVNNLGCFTKDSPVAQDLGTHAVYANASDVLADWGVSSNVYKAAAKVFSQSPNVLTGGGRFIVVPMVGEETLADAYTRISASVYLGGFSDTFAADDSEVTAAAVVAQAARKLFFVCSNATASVEAAGLLNVLYAAGYTQTRGLLHTASAAIAEDFKWAYAGRAMATNFSGSNTTQTMHLKQLSGVAADTGITSTVLTAAGAVGTDVYVSIAGRASVFTSGTNGFFDDIFNLQWLLGALEVAGFNQLAQSGTKLPQTEAGMDSLKGAYRTVCEQAVRNLYVAAGTWTSADTFGDPEDFHRNIQERGYYIYSAPISTQLAADREARQAPLVQIAVKAAGAIHSSNAIIYVNR